MKSRNTTSSQTKQRLIFANCPIFPYLFSSILLENLVLEDEIFANYKYSRLQSLNEVVKFREMKVLG